MAGVIFASCVAFCFGAKRRLPSTDVGGRGRAAWLARLDHAGHLLADRRQLCTVRPDRASRGVGRGPCAGGRMGAGALAAIILKLCWVQAPQVAVGRNRSDARLGRSRGLPAVADAPPLVAIVLRSPPAGVLYNRRRRRLHATPSPDPTPTGLRLPRAVSRAHRRGRRVRIRRGRLLRAPSGIDRSRLRDARETW